MITQFFRLLLVLFALTGCAPPEYFVAGVGVPAGSSAAAPRLSSGSDGRLVLSWLERSDNTVSLRFAEYAATGWHDARTVSEASNMLVNWADLPSVLPLRNGRVAAHWLVLSGAHGHAYDIAYAESPDNGHSWTPAVTPHSDGTATEHGFVSLYESGDAVGLLWLDGRNTANAAGGNPVTNGTTLRGAIFAEGLQVEDEQLIDELVCDCCQTDVAIAASGPIAVYRDRSRDEIRDVNVTRRLAGKWTTGSTIASDNWKINGCPVNGPAIAASGRTVAVAWFTAAEVPQVNAAFSEDSGETFSAPIEIVRGTTTGRVAIAVLENDDVAVSWLDSAASSATIQVRRVGGHGSLGPVRLVAGAADALTVPQMKRSGPHLVFAWRASPGEGGHIASARVEIDSL